MAQQRHRSRGLLGIASLAAGVFFWGFFHSVSFVEPLPRRDVFAVGAAAVLAGPAVLLPQATLAAETGASGAGSNDPDWQLKLPKDWPVLQALPVPADGGPVELLVAGNEKIGGEVSVWRIPVDGKPAASDGAALIKFLAGSGKPSKGSKEQEEAVRALVGPFTRMQGLSRLTTLEETIVRVKLDRRYMYVDFEMEVCDPEVGGVLQYGKTSNLCADRDGKEFDMIPIHHTMVATVDRPDQTSDKGVLWFADISAPSTIWGDLTDSVGIMLDSFALGDFDELEKQRDMELKALQEFQKKLVEAQQLQGQAV